jgi:polar amino acid transport system substrate-binding protein
VRNGLPILLAGAIACSAAQGAEVARLAIGEWPPYTSEQDPGGKVAEAIVTAAFRQEGVAVSYGYFPWKRSLSLVEGGQYDGTFPWNSTPERVARFVVNVVPILGDEGVFFHLKGTAFSWNTLEDLKRYRVGVTLGFKQEKTYAEHGIQADPVATEEQNFRKMLAGRIDVYETSRRVGYYLVHRLFKPEQARLFTHDPKVVEANAYHVLFTRRSPRGKALAARFDAGLRKLMRSGEYQRILDEAARIP